MGVLTYGLSEGVHPVSDLQVGQHLADLLRQVAGGETHGVDVVGAGGERAGRGLQHLQCGPQAVIWIKVEVEEEQGG